MVHKRKFQSIRWQDGNKFYSKIDMSQGWSLYIRPSDKDYSSFLKFDNLDVKCSVTNNSEDKIYIDWHAVREEEKQSGEIVHKYNSDNSEKRSKTLKPNEKAYWHVGKMKDLVYNHSLSVGFASNIEIINLTLQLEFEDHYKLEELVNIKEFKIPVVGRRSF